MHSDAFGPVKAYNDTLIRDLIRPRFSPSHALAILAWASVFVLSWLLILRLIPSDGLSWSFFAFFLVLALVASAIASPTKIKTK